MKSTYNALQKETERKFLPAISPTQIEPAIASYRARLDLVNHLIQGLTILQPDGDRPRTTVPGSSRTGLSLVDRPITQRASEPRSDQAKLMDLMTENAKLKRSIREFSRSNAELRRLIERGVR